MKAKTKLQHKLIALSDNLPKITEAHKAWSFKHCLKHIGYRTKKNISCMDCGHIWDGPNIDILCECPACGSVLEVENSRKKTLYQRRFLAVIEVCEDYQVNRFFEITHNTKAGKPSHFHIWEVVQLWILPNVRCEIIGRNRILHWNQDSFHGDMEFRNKFQLHNKYNIYPDKVYPGVKCLPIYKRNGFKNNFRGLTPYEMFTALLNDTKAETLVKTNQFSLLNARISSRAGAIDRHWNSIKICIRANYIVKNAITWLDYLDLLAHYKKDLRSQKYVCPENLRLEHDRLVKKKNAIPNQIAKERRAANREFQKQQAKERLKRIESDNKAYIEAKKHFFGIEFTKDTLTIKVLESVHEFKIESDAHEHCVFSNEYYKRTDSLILSARIGNKLVETIEVTLPNMKIAQARGKNNKATKYHNQILELMNANMKVIRKKYRELKKIAA